MQKIRELLNKYSEQNSLISLLVLGLSVWAFIYLVLLVPLRTQRLEMAQNVEKLQLQIADLQAYDISDAEFNAKQQLLNERQYSLQQQLPPTYEDFKAIMQLTADIKAHKLNIRSIKISNQTQQTDYQQQRLDCIVSGNYFELIALLEYLQKRHPLTNVQINSITLETDDRLSVSMQVIIYILP